MHPCPCGYYGDPLKPCTCSSAMAPRYPKRISGPLLDRVDIPITVPRVDHDRLSEARQRAETLQYRPRLADN